MTKEDLKQTKHLDDCHLDAAHDLGISLEKLEQIAWVVNSSGWQQVHALAGLLRLGYPTAHVKKGDYDYGF